MNRDIRSRNEREKEGKKQMKTLDIKPYCDDCPEFEPCVNNATLRSERAILLVNTTISCTHAERCRRIYEFLEKKKEGRT